MLTNQCKRLLSAFLAFVMVLSMLPVPARAAELEDHTHTEEIPVVTGEDAVFEVVEDSEIAEAPVEIVSEIAETPVEEVAPETTAPAVSQALVDLKAIMDDILLLYLGTTEMAAGDVIAAVNAMEQDTYWNALVEVDDFENSDAVAHLTEEEIHWLAENNTTFGEFGSALYARRANDRSFDFLAVSKTVLDGAVTVTDSVGTGTESGGTVTITAKGGLLSKKTNTVTITNTSGKAATLSFDYSLSNYKSYTVLPAAKGQYSSFMQAGDTYEFTFTADSGYKTATLTLRNFSLVEAAAASDVTIEYDSAMGSVTAAGSAVSSGATVEDVSLTDGVALVASPASGVTFLGWIDATTRELLSTAASYTYIPAADSTVIAAFAKADTNSWFAVGTKYYDDLNVAATAAVSGGGVVVLVSNGTLPAGDYSIPSGVTLVIPYSDSASSNANPLTEPTRIPEKNTYVAPSVFRTLTVPSGATINCAGNIRVDACQYSASTQYTGHVYGAYGKIALEGTINLTGTATLRAYGYITGGGTVNAATSTTVYELFQMADWRGGNNTSNLYEGMKGDSFLVSCFYIQNIESKLVLNSGSSLIVHVSIAAASINIFDQDKVPYNSSAKLVASDGLFQLGSGAKLTRSYSGGRMTYKVEGDSKFGSISLKLSTGLGSFNMNSNEYILNLPSHMTIQFASGTADIPVKVKLLPGTILQIDSGATVNMSNSAELVIYDNDDWKSGNYTYNSIFHAVKYSVGTKMGSLPNTPGQLIVNGALSIGNGAAVYSTNKAGTTGNNGLSGSGKITIGTAPANKRSTVTEINGSSTNKVTVDVTPLQALLKGISTSTTDYTHSMASEKTYYGTGSDWYNHVVNTDSTGWGKISVTEGVTSATSVSHSKHDTISNALGYVTYSTDKQSPFSFTVNAQCVKAETSNGTLSANNELTALTNHATISLRTKHASDKVNYTINGDGTHTVKHTCCGASDAPVAHSFTNYACVCGVKQTFTVTWKEEGKKDVTSTVNGGVKITLPTPAPSKEGYDFVGWFDGNTQATADTICTGNVAYTAKFELKTYTVTWKAEGQPDVTVEYQYGAQITKPSDDPQKAPAEGEKCVKYEFSGWSDAPNGTPLTEFPTAKADVTYYAVFKAVPDHSVNTTEWLKDESGHWHPCTVCGFKFDTAEHTYANGQCECGWQQITAGNFSINATSVRAGYGLDLYFYVDADDVKSYDGCYAKIVRTYADGRANDVKEINVTSWEPYQGGSLRFCYSNIAAKEMTDKLTVTIYSADGTPLTMPVKQSVEDYAVRMLKHLASADEDSERYLRTTLVDMLNYGAAAQQTLKYNASVLANAKIGSYQDYATKDEDLKEYNDYTKNPDEFLKAASISAESNLKFTFYFDFKGVDISGYSAIASYTDHYGKAQTPPLGNFVTGTMTENGQNVTVYGIDVPGLAIADGRQMITCKILDRDNKEVTEVESSVESYIATTINYLEETDETFVAKDSVYFKLMKFIDSAHTYFHPNT